jgi:hypothetical protein
MEDLSLHILDIAENSVAAQADRIEIRLTEDLKRDLMSFEVVDNGVGMDEDTKKKALDPFFTSKKVRRIGLGLSLLSESAREANGHLSIYSKKGKGTRVKAVFQYGHIDRRPLGNIGQTILTLIIGNPDIDFIYIHKKDRRKYVFDTREIRFRLVDVPINSLEGMKLIKEELGWDLR